MIVVRVRSRSKGGPVGAWTFLLSDDGVVSRSDYFDPNACVAIEADPLGYTSAEATRLRRIRVIAAVGRTFPIPNSACPQKGSALSTHGVSFLVTLKLLCKVVCAPLSMSQKHRR